MLKKSKLFLLLLVIPVILNTAVFIWAYFFGGDITPPNQFPLYLVVSILSWFFVKINIWKKVALIFLTVVINCVLNTTLIYSTVFIPGDKEHDYIMYEVCLPKMHESYGITENKPFPTPEGVDKKGNGKWWYQHLECEKNVKNGKGPIWSENPPKFIPVKQ